MSDIFLDEVEIKARYAGFLKGKDSMRMGRCNANNLWILRLDKLRENSPCNSPVPVMIVDNKLGYPHYSSYSTLISDSGEGYLLISDDLGVILDNSNCMCNHIFCRIEFYS